VSLFKSFFCSIVLLILSIPSFAEPVNLSLVKKEIEQYHDAGMYEKELTEAIEKAHNFILEQSKLNKDKKLAIVLDIDETSLSNYDKMVKREFIGDKERIHQEILAADSPVIAPMLALYKDSLEHNIKVFFVTGRVESERKATEANLLRAGYSNWADLILRPQDYHKPSIIPFKSKARQSITNKGYTILASIGDQSSDIAGGFAMKGFKLPNPYYYLP
jgi:predicted secreted acid phosphatase